MKPTNIHNDIWNSLEGMQKASPSPSLYFKIKQQLEEQKEHRIPQFRVALAFASIALLIASNILLNRMNNHQRTQTNASHPQETSFVNNEQLY